MITYKWISKSQISIKFKSLNKNISQSDRLIKLNSMFPFILWDIKEYRRINRLICHKNNKQLRVSRQYEYVYICRVYLIALVAGLRNSEGHQLQSKMFYSVNIKNYSDEESTVLRDKSVLWITEKFYHVILNDY